MGGRVSRQEFPVGRFAKPGCVYMAGLTNSAKAWCYWWSLNGAASKAGITHDFDEMQKRGYPWAHVGTHFDRHWTWWPTSAAWRTYSARRECRPVDADPGDAGGITASNCQDLQAWPLLIRDRPAGIALGVIHGKLYR